jgi:1-acyl-sn-glycerol-3-phosphate acyltransferase
MLSASASFLGRFSGRFVMGLGLIWMRKRAERFQVCVAGVEHLRNLKGAYLLVSNHVTPKVPIFGRFAHVRGIRQFNHSLDSFIYYRVVLQETGRRICTVANCDRGWWSPRPFFRQLQKQIGQPFAKAQMEAMGFIPVEGNPDCFQRDFLRSSAKRVGKGDPILIFPEGINYEEFDFDHNLRPGAAHLAKRFHLPVVPAYINGSDSWQPAKPIYVRFGEAFTIEGLDKKEIADRIGREIERLMRSHQAQHACSW